jgi:K+-sensing histidine kinase KdpD
MPAGPNRVSFAMTDEGCGMTPDVAARAFEPFFTTKPAGQGSGLGLSQAYGFVAQSNGEIGIETAPGRGTTVRFLLPADRGNGAADAAGHAGEDAASPLAKPPARKSLGREPLGREHVA